VAAEQDDLLINADNQDLDYKNNTLHFTGNVVVTQGAISIIANELFVVTEDGNGEKLVAKGTPATFKQTDEEQGELVAKADEIIYLVEAQILQLNGNARFEQGGSLVQSGTIEFDLAAQRVKADGDQSTGGRVTTTLKTKKNSSPE
jgi:lipopolysaccharide export system protein LptA